MVQSIRSKPSETPRHRRTDVVVSFALIAMTLIAYWTVLSCGFVGYDDDDYVYRNKHVLDGLSWSGIWYALTTLHHMNWHPLMWLSLELDATFWGLVPTGYHITNLVFHTLNVLLIFIVVKSLTGATYRSACVAAFFAVHPLHVESVAWISERKDVLSTFFLLLTIAAYIRYSMRPSVDRYWPVLVLFTLGLMAKAMLVTAPLLLLFLDYWPLNRTGVSQPRSIDCRFPKQSLRTLFLEKLPLLAIAFADGVLTLLAQKGASKLLSDLTFGVRIANAFHAYCWYLKKTFIPIDLIIFYPHPEQDLPWPTIVISVMVMTAISVWVLYRAKTAPHLVFGWLWFVVSLLPVIGLLQVGGQAYADRYSYVPHIGLFVAIVWEVHAWIQNSEMGRKVAAVVTVCLLVACIFLTRSQVIYFTDSETLWTHAIDVIPDNYVANSHMAFIRFSQRDFERAERHFERYCRHKRMQKSRTAAGAYHDWGVCLAGLNRAAEAEQKFRHALAIRFEYELALSDLTQLLVTQGRRAEAIPFMKLYESVQREKPLEAKAVQDPNSQWAQSILGKAQARRGNVQQAIIHLKKAVEFDSESAIAHYDLARVLVINDQSNEAKSHFIKAIELDLQLVDAHFRLGELLESEGDVPGAKDQFSEVLRIDPDDVGAKEHLDRLSKL